MLITEHYRDLNAQKHRESANYGSYGHNIAGQVRAVAREISATSILDYGCGKRTLEKELGFAINNYDPAIPGLEALPEPADLVVCCDVLEHIEPDCLVAVLDDLKRVTLKAAILVIDCKPANKHLPDGRNAHLIVERPNWWLAQLLHRFDIDTVRANKEGLLVLAKKTVTQ